MSKHSIFRLLMTVGRAESADFRPVLAFPVPDAEEDAPATEAGTFMMISRSTLLVRSPLKVMDMFRYYFPFIASRGNIGGSRYLGQGS